MDQEHQKTRCTLYSYIYTSNYAFNFGLVKRLSETKRKRAELRKVAGGAVGVVENKPYYMNIRSLYGTKCFCRRRHQCFKSMGLNFLFKHPPVASFPPPPPFFHTGG